MLPLGFEIAAKNSDPDSPWTLQQVVDGFNDCNYVKDQNGNPVLNSSGEPIVQNDPVGKPFCHLIDPNWILRFPISKCNASVNGPTPLAPGLPTRLEECSDMSSCVGYNDDGTCYTYGYCTREKNTWADSGLTKCDAWNRTCRAFTDATGKQVAYLYRTLDTGYCTADNTGCTGYSFAQDASGDWLSPADPSIFNPKIYFNAKLPQDCSSQSAGCTAFKLASDSNTILYLRQAPDYLGCNTAPDNWEDVLKNPESAGALWPQNQI